MTNVRNSASVFHIAKFLRVSRHGGRAWQDSDETTLPHHGSSPLEGTGRPATSLLLRPKHKEECLARYKQCTNRASEPRTLASGTSESGTSEDVEREDRLPQTGVIVYISFLILALATLP